MSQLIIPKAAGSVTSVNAQTGVVTLVTDNIPQTNSTKYFSLSDTRQCFTVSNTLTGTGSGCITYNSNTGVFIINSDIFNNSTSTLLVRSVSGDIGVNTLYANIVVVQNSLSGVNSLTFPQGTFNALTINTSLYLPLSGVVYAKGLGNNIRPATTTDLPEGTNLYFTQSRILSTSGISPSSLPMGSVLATDSISATVLRLNNMVQALSSLLLSHGWTI